MTRVQLEISVSHGREGNVIGIGVPAMNQKLRIRPSIDNDVVVVIPLFRYLDWIINSRDAEKCSEAIKE